MGVWIFAIVAYCLLSDVRVKCARLFDKRAAALACIKGGMDSGERVLWICSPRLNHDDGGAISADQPLAPLSRSDQKERVLHFPHLPFSQRCLEAFHSYVAGTVRGIISLGTIAPQSS
jgi:hypothetical protein